MYQLDLRSKKSNVVIFRFRRNERRLQTVASLPRSTKNSSSNGKDAPFQKYVFFFFFTCTYAVTLNLRRQICHVGMGKEQATAAQFQYLLRLLYPPVSPKEDLILGLKPGRFCYHVLLTVKFLGIMQSRFSFATRGFKLCKRR